MRDLLADIGIALVCETCDGEVDLLSESPVCRQCGVAFLVDAEQEESAARPA